jgi:hypothetical protein
MHVQTAFGTDLEDPIVVNPEISGNRKAEQTSAGNGIFSSDFTLECKIER